MVRLAVHFLRGLAIVTLRFPRWPQERRDAGIRRWSKKLLSILAVRLHAQNLPEPLPGGCLLALNHVSWLDIFVLDAAHPAMFVAKSDIRGWPLVGTLVTKAGTLYLDRRSPAALRRTNLRIGEALAAGALVACFPEGATTAGDTVGKFHAALLQPALDARATIRPVALRYRDAKGLRTEAPAYIGEDSLLESLWKIVSTSSMTAELRFLPALPPERRIDRRALAEQLREGIARELDAP